MIKKAILYILSVICIGFWWGCTNIKEPDSDLELEIGQFLDLEYPVITPVDDALVPDSVRSAYREDAARLAVRIMHEVEGEAATMVEIPEELWNTLYATLIHVYQAKQLAARDSVVSMFDIHTFPNPELYRIVISLDSTKQWVRQWRTGNTPTGNDTIDNLLSTYELELDRYDVHPTLPDFVVLRSPRPLDLLGLAYLFAAVDGVFWAEPDGWVGDGPDIVAQVGTDHWLLTYSLSWGDCPSGCIHHHFWLFEVSTSGVVTYLGSSGNPIPELII